MHSIWTILFWHSIWQKKWRSSLSGMNSWHSMWHSICNKFWHILGLLFGFVKSHSFWHTFWRSIWHKYLQSIWHKFWLIVWQSGILSLGHSIWHKLWPSICHKLWEINLAVAGTLSCIYAGMQCGTHSDIVQPFYLAYILRSILNFLTFYLEVWGCPLWSSARSWSRQCPLRSSTCGWGHAYCDLALAVEDREAEEEAKEAGRGRCDKI